MNIVQIKSIKELKIFILNLIKRKHFDVHFFQASELLSGVIFFDDNQLE
jgi:hypothetical protein